MEKRRREAEGWLSGRVAWKAGLMPPTLRLVDSRWGVGTSLTPDPQARPACRTAP